MWSENCNKEGIENNPDIHITNHENDNEKRDKKDCTKYVQDCMF